MPRDNYGFRGDALTPAAAFAAGAAVSSQEYQYAVQLNYVTPVSDGPTFDNVTTWTQSDTASSTTWSATGSGTNTLAVSNSVAGTSKYGHHYVEFTLASACILDIDNWQFDGSYPVVSGIDYPCISTSGAFPGFSLDKDGRRRSDLPYRYGTIVATKPIRYALSAGTWRLEWTYAGNGAATKTSSFTAVLSTLPSYTKSFNNNNGTTGQKAFQGLGTDKLILYAMPGNSVSVRYATNQTDTTFAFGLATGNSVTVSVNYYDITASGRSYLTSNGWGFDDKPQNYIKLITGATTLTIPAMGVTRTTAGIGVSGTTNQSMTITIVS